MREKRDPNLAVPAARDDLDWIDARAIGLEGRGFVDTAAPYDRLPRMARQVVSEAVWELQQESAGISVRFRTSSPEIRVRWSLTSPVLASTHMPATGVSGVDLYSESTGSPRFVGVGQPSGQSGNLARFPGSQDGQPCTFQLNLPLYNGVTRLELGVPAGFGIEGVREKDRRPPLCFYGSSIVQGGCASRPGMPYAAIICRRLGVECINLGFSGSGRAEPEIAEILAELEARAWVLDPLPNMSADTITERLGNLVRVLRRAHPRVPLVLVEHLRPSSLPPPPDRPMEEDWRRANRMLRELVNTLKREGTRDLTVVAGETLLGEDGEATVDGIHPTDLGFARMAEVLGATVREALGL
jgi:hypothetical protein